MAQKSTLLLYLILGAFSASQRPQAKIGDDLREKDLQDAMGGTGCVCVCVSLCTCPCATFSLILFFFFSKTVLNLFCLENFVNQALLRAKEGAEHVIQLHCNRAHNVEHYAKHI